MAGGNTPYEGRTTIEYNGKQVNLEELRKEMLNEKIEEASRIITNVSDGEGNTSNKFASDEFEKEYKKRYNTIVEYIYNQAATIMTEETLKGALENFEDTILAKTRGTGEDLTDDRVFGQDFGWFVEKAWFGIPRSTTKKSDIEAITTEIKAQTARSARDIRIGGMVATGLKEDLEKNEYALKIILAHKMYTKMQNFLYVKAEADPATSGGTSRHISYKEISIHTDLILQKLWDLVFEETRGFAQKVVKIKRGTFRKPAKGEDVGKMSLMVTMSMSGVNQAYQWLSLYLYNMDLLRDIKNNDGFRRNFFSVIDRIQREVILDVHDIPFKL